RWSTRFHILGLRDPAAWNALRARTASSETVAEPALPPLSAPAVEPLRLLSGKMPTDSLEPVAELAPRLSYFAEDGTDVVTFDWRSLKKVWAQGLFQLMEAHLAQAEQSGKPNKITFAFVSDVPGLSSEQMLDALQLHGLPERVKKSLLLVDQATLKDRGVLRKGAIQVQKLSLVMGEMLLHRWNTGLLRLKVVVDSENAHRWQGDVLKVLLTPAGTGEIVSTSLGLMVAIEGEMSDRIVTFIRQYYPAEVAERLLSRIQKSAGRILLPATTTTPQQDLPGKLKNQQILDTQA
ncbi:MAG TPA: hypothetical protein P5079_10710, partial [Elusimicrobiota bacterium]|nr:hypothetical protein [Elusimicrobiota bacterium]